MDLVLAEGSVDLIDADPRYLAAIDGLVSQGTWFRGEPSAGWNDPAGGDTPNTASGPHSTESLLRQYSRYLAAGKPVFTIGYCLKPANAAMVYSGAARLGLTPLVSQVSLAGITTTPPAPPAPPALQR